MFVVGRFLQYLESFVDLFCCVGVCVAQGQRGTLCKRSPFSNCMLHTVEENQYPTFKMLCLGSYFGGAQITQNDLTHICLLMEAK